MGGMEKADMAGWERWGVRIYASSRMACSLCGGPTGSAVSRAAVALCCHVNVAARRSPTMRVAIC